MDKMEQIFEEYKEYRKENSKKTEKLDEATLRQYCTDITFVLKLFETNPEEMFKDEQSLNYYLQKYEKFAEEKQLNKNTILSYKSDCKNFYKFWQKRKERPTRYYLCCQKKDNYKEERKQEILKTDTESSHVTRTRIMDLGKGDIVLNYIGSKIIAISEVLGEYIETEKNGYKQREVKVRYYDINAPLTLENIRKQLNDKDENFIKPFYRKKDGTIWGPEGYLHPMGKNLYDLLSSNFVLEKTKRKDNMNDKEKILQPLNQILYGPPGTGKTYNTVIKAMEIIGIPEIMPEGYDENKYKELSDKLKKSKTEKQDYDDNEYEILKKEFDKQLGKQIEFVTFHQSYSYEEFVEGIKPLIQYGENWQEPTEKMQYVGKDGIFKTIWNSAENKLYADSSANISFEQVIILFFSF